MESTTGQGGYYSDVFSLLKNYTEDPVKLQTSIENETLWYDTTNIYNSAPHLANRLIQDHKPTAKEWQDC